MKLKVGFKILLLNSFSGSTLTAVEKHHTLT
jgi:hypothetical protein